MVQMSQATEQSGFQNVNDPYLKKSLSAIEFLRKKEENILNDKKVTKNIL